MEILHKFFNQHKGMRRLCLFWAMWLTTIAVLRVTDPAVITAVPVAAATILTAIIGLVGTMIHFYNQGRHKEDAHNDGKP